jgi:adenylate cyclase
VAPLVLGVGILIGVAKLTPGSDHFLAGLDRQLLDTCHVNGSKTPPREDIVILGIDDASLTLASAWPEDIAASPALQAMQQPFPWPRRVWAETIHRLCDAGARLVFIDLAFVAPGADPDDDKLLRDALDRHAGRVLLGAKFDHSQVGGAIISNLVYPSPTLTGTSLPEPGSFGLLNFWPDADQVIRSLDLQITRSEVDGGIPDPEEKPLPSVALAAASILHPDQNYSTDSTVRLRFCPLESYPPASLHTIFIPDLWQSNFGSGAFFNDKVVFVGASAAELQDFQRIPSGTVFGVQLHAHALTATLAQSFLQSTGASWDWGCLVAGMLLAWLLITVVRQPILALVLLILAGCIFTAASFWLFESLNFEASPLTFNFALMFCGTAALSGNSLGQLREQRQLQRFLARYTSPELTRELLRDKAGFLGTLGGVERNVTILFSDVRGFTSLSEASSATEVVTQLNEYLSSMVEQVFLQRGSVDKFIGDAVMALWGSMRIDQGQAGDKTDAENALAAALGMRNALRQLNVEWKARDIAEFTIGIGIHQGPAVVGNIGSEAPYEKMDLTVIGDSVNLASRLESITKQYGVDIIISEQVHAHVEADFLCRSVDLVKVMGKEKPVTTYTVLGPLESSFPAGLEAYEAGVQAYRAGRFSEARIAFHEAASAGMDDSLTRLHLERCAALLQSPPAFWDGVYVMRSK